MPWVHWFTDKRYHETAVLPQTKQRSGIIVWACFCGPIKGPVIIWDYKNWGNICSESYCEHILPKVDAFNTYLWDEYRIDTIFMQDRASSHTSYYISERLYALDINIDEGWHPAVSPNLNPQENMWNYWKDDISKQCGAQNLQPSRHDILRKMIFTAWDRIPEAYFDSLGRSMPNRAAELIEKKGAATHY